MKGLQDAQCTGTCAGSPFRRCGRRCWRPYGHSGEQWCRMCLGDAAAGARKETTAATEDGGPADAHKDWRWRRDVAKVTEGLADTGTLGEPVVETLQKSPSRMGSFAAAAVTGAGDGGICCPCPCLSSPQRT